MSETIEIESIQRLDIKPGETLVVKLPPGTTREAMTEMRRTLITNLPTGIHLLLATGDVDLSVVARTDLGEPPPPLKDDPDLVEHYR